MGFINTLQTLLDEKGISRNKFCADIGVNKNAVSNWENRGTVPGGKTLAKISTYFEVPIEHLTETEKPTDSERRPATRRETLMQEARRELSELPDSELERALSVLRALKQK